MMKIVTGPRSLRLGFVSEPEGLVLMLLRSLLVAQCAAREAPVVERLGVVRLDPNGLILVL
jgi:hypothetical protein